MSKELEFFVIVGVNDLDGVFVQAIYRDWNKAAAHINGRPDLRIRSVKTLEENF
jgi:hypothetical protein